MLDGLEIRHLKNVSKCSFKRCPLHQSHGDIRQNHQTKFLLFLQKSRIGTILCRQVLPHWRKHLHLTVEDAFQNPFGVQGECLLSDAAKESW